MVSLWPWKKDDTSPASFEKALSVLSDNISKYQVKLDSLRQNSRRIGLLWMLYSVFAYILCSAILALVVGWRSWGVIEYTAVAGSPLVIYLVKTAITTYYTYRVESVTKRLEGYQAERTKTIEKLKAATKFNSTQQLIEKYGGPSPSPSSPGSGKKPKAQGKPGPRGGQNIVQRTGMGPPPTANVPRNAQPSSPSTPQPFTDANALETSRPPAFPVPDRKPSPNEPGPPEFAPNAFSSPSHLVQNNATNQGGNWYDRILDAILGEDETMAKNRLALICENCKLVLGQAPPGVKRLEDVGKWKCGACGAWNGVEDEGKKIVKEMRQQAKMEIHDQPVDSVEKDDPIGISSGGDGDDEMQTEDYEFEEEEEEEVPVSTSKLKKEKSKTSRKK